MNGADHTHQLMGLVCSRVPCVNSAASILSCLDRPIMYAEMLGIRNRHGKEKDGSYKFPLVEQEYFANQAPTSIRPTFPTVMKMSQIQSGFGKLRAPDNETFGDITAIQALSSDYFTTEPHMADVEAEIYLQWIGGEVRVYKRKKSSSDGGFRTWSNWGTVQYQDMCVRPRLDCWLAGLNSG